MAHKSPLKRSDVVAKVARYREASKLAGVIRRTGILSRPWLVRISDDWTGSDERVVVVTAPISEARALLKAVKGGKRTDGYRARGEIRWRLEWQIPKGGRRG